ncbi:MAG TPA: substrate-binding domain-containing protein [Propionibacteriaceae bacterium]
MNSPEWPHLDQFGRPTLRTIAELSGVSASTVSRVLHPGKATVGRKTATETTRRILAAAQQVRYVPNPHAASLRTQRSFLIGVLVPQLADLVLALIYEGVEDAASDLGYGTFVTNTHDDPDTQRLRADMMLNRRVDGLILGDARADHGLADALRSRGVAYVLTNRRVEGHPSVTGDDRLGGRLVAQHLLDLGHTAVGVVAGAPYASTGIDRTAGFSEVYAHAGHPVPPDLVVPSPFDVTGGHVATEQLLAVRPDLTAIFVVNDFAAIGAMGAIRRSGRTLGHDVALVGYNDVPLAAQLPVPMTTVRSPMREMGYGAVEMLMKRMDGQEVEPVLLRPELVVRESTQPDLSPDTART